MKKYLIIDSRMRKIEKNFLENNNYQLIELPKSNNVYSEISSHIDIFTCKIHNKLIVEKTYYDYLKNNIIGKNIICGESFVESKYPKDIKYNVCEIGNYVIHNFKFTDKRILDVIKEEKFLNKIKISQGYSNCSIAVIDKNSAIVNDKKIAKILRENNIDVLCLDYIPDIKLLTNNLEYSKMKGFIGGAISRIDNKIIVFGDLNKIDIHNQIRNFIEKRNLQIIDFKGLDVIDYGGVLEI